MGPEDVNVMRRYSMFAAWFLSFFSGGLYRDVARNWNGIGIFYLLVLLGLTWLPWAWQTDRAIKTAVAKDLSKVSDQIPKMALKNGKFSVEAPQPHFIRNPDDQKVIAILDTTGEVTSLDGQEAILLVTQDTIVFRDRNNHRIQEQDLSQIGMDMTMDGTKLEELGNKFAGVIAPLMFPFAWIGSFVYRWVQALIYGAIGLLMASVFGARVSYAGSVRMAAVAATPVIVANTVMELVPNLEISGFLWNPIALAIPLAFLAFGAKSNAGFDEPGDVVPPPLPQNVESEARYVS